MSYFDAQKAGHAIGNGVSASQARARTPNGKRQAIPPNKAPRVKNGGGFNPSFGVNVNVTKSSGGGRTPAASTGGGAAGTPGADFMSNEDIRAFTEHVRKDSRTRAVERAMDAAQIEAVLRNIPDGTGSMAGARMRARRVSRWLKRIAKAEQLIAKWATAMYAQFEREYESELRKVGKGRTQPQPRAPFGWR